MIAAWIAFPLVLLVLTLGCGLLLERATGRPLGLLLVPGGLAVVIVAAELPDDDGHHGEARHGRA